MGDLAVMDQDGYVQIVGRIKDMIIMDERGDSFMGREIRGISLSAPAISEVQVFGVPDEKMGEKFVHL